MATITKNISALAPAIGTATKTAKVAGAAIGLSGGFATLYFGTLSVFMRPMAEAFSWSRGQTSGVIVLAMLGLALGAPLVGRLSDKFGVNRVIPISVLLFAIALFGMSMMPGNLAMFAVLSLVIGIIATATTPAGYLSVLPKYFDKRLGLALGLAMMGLGLGTVLAPIVTQHWISTHGWEYAYRALSVVALLFGGIACFTLFSGKNTINASPAARAAQTEASLLPGADLGTAVRTGRFWLIAAIIFAVSAAGLGATVHAVSMFVDRGLPADIAANGVAVAGVGVMLGRIAAGALMDVIHASKVAALAFLLGAIGLAFIAFNPSPSFAVMAFGALLFGFTVGTEGDLIPFLVRRYFGLKAFGSVFGLLFGVYSLGGVTGPVLFGVSFDKVGSYQPALIAAAVLCVLAGIAVMLLGPYRYSAATISTGKTE